MQINIAVDLMVLALAGMFPSVQSAELAAATGASVPHLQVVA